MLEHKQLALIGGDQRYVQAINHLADNNATLYIDGFIDANISHPNVHQLKTEQIPFEQLDGIVLPVTGMDDTGNIALHYPEEKTMLTENMMNKTPDSCVIYTGTANDYLRKFAEKCNRKLIVLFERDDMAIANSIPTAEATLQIAMEETDFTINGANVLITGFGRIGITIARLFHQMGANVTVAARKSADFARITEMRMEPVHMNQLRKAVRKCDITINTVPHLVLTQDIISSMTKDALIIDLASHPGGTDFEAAEGNGIKAILALGLPGKVAPKTAGDIIGQTIAQLVNENK